jgi:hypothetical protein
VRSVLRAAVLGLLVLQAAAAPAKAPPASKSSELSDAEIKRRMIAESIADYPGPCPCPYNTARNGSSCGKRSAWSRPGGATPLCYPSDISADMIADYRASHQETAAR